MRDLEDRHSGKRRLDLPLHSPLHCGRSASVRASRRLASSSPLSRLGTSERPRRRSNCLDSTSLLSYRKTLWIVGLKNANRPPIDLLLACICDVVLWAIVSHLVCIGACSWRWRACDLERISEFRNVRRQSPPSVPLVGPRDPDGWRIADDLAHSERSVCRRDDARHRWITGHAKARARGARATGLHVLR